MHELVDDNKKQTLHNSADIQNIFDALASLASRPSVAPGSEPIPDDALDMIRDLKQALLHKQDKHEARTMHDDLLNRIAEL